MSYEVLFRIKDGPLFGLSFGSSRGMLLLGDWIESIPEELYPNLRALIMGEPADAGAACMEIDPALEAYPPKVEWVAETADQLGDVLDRWPDETLALISDGANTPVDWWPDEEDADEEEKGDQ